MNLLSNAGLISGQVIVWLIVALALCFILALIIKALMFKPKDAIHTSTDKVEVDEEKIVKNFTDFIKCKTITVTDTENGDYSEHEKFIALIQERFPNVFKKCEFERVNKWGLILKFKGKSSENSSVIMSHYDVVPINPANWTVPPFEGVVKDGKIFGRGTVDNKATLLCSMTAMEGILQSDPNFIPENDIYFTFGGDEETTGLSQQKIVKEFEAKKVSPRLVLDEGGAIVKNIFPGVEEEVAVIGLSEKGIANVQLYVDSNGGHASTPSKDNPVNVLARALVKLESKPMKPFIVQPVAEMLDTLGRRSTFTLKLIFANMWLFKGLVKKIFTKGSAETNAMMTTTFAYTTLSGSISHNVLPNQARVNLNIRIANNHTIDEVLEHIKKTIDDDRVKVEVMVAYNPSPIAETDGFAYQTVKETMNETYPEVVVSPYVMLAASDSRFYRNISDGTLKFAPFRLTKEQRGAVHGDDENIEISALVKGTEFYTRLFKKI